MTTSTSTAGRSVTPEPVAGPVPDRTIGTWLLICCVMVFLTAVVGAATRLTQSGLSITVWEPIIGILPPLSPEAWQRAFDLYRESPEYQHLNRGMSFDEFRFIFWWEYWHRIVARLVGLVFFVPFVWLWVRGRRGKGEIRLGIIITLMIGAQGFMGWYMVQSGLVDEPRVSQYRLTAHLTLALVILVAMLWWALDRLSPTPGGRVVVHPRMVSLLAGLGATTLTLAIVTGGFVAGLDAGLVHNTFPLMSGQLVPFDLFMLQPWWVNVFENPSAAQFVHRLLAFTTLGLLVALWIVARGSLLPDAAVTPGRFLPWLAVAQVTLGAATVLTHVSLYVAVAHQAVAIILLGTMVWLVHALWRGRGIPSAD